MFLLDFDCLQMFAEAADSSGAGVPTGENAAGTPTPDAEGQAGADTPLCERTAATDSADAGRNADAEFEALVGKGGKYAEAFAKRAQASFNKRYAGFKATEEKAQRLERFKNAVASDYSDVDANDLDALEKAYLTDAKRFSARAMETGESAEELAKNDYMNRKLKELEEREKVEKSRRARDAEARKFYSAVAKQEQAMTKKYAGFNLEDELQNEVFRALVMSNVPLEEAYWAVHREELTNKAISDAKNATVQSIAAKGTRPPEAAAASSVPAVSKVDYSKMSRKEFMKIFNE